MEEADSERERDLQEALFSAIQEGDLKKVKDCAQFNAELKNKEGYTPLEWACYSGNEEIALFVIEGSAGQRFYTQSAFLHATEKGMFEVVTKLNRFASGKDIRFALAKACCTDKAEIAKLLIDTGVNVRDLTDSDGQGLLLLPCFHGYIKICKLLINAGANPNGSRESCYGTFNVALDGDVPLFAASLNGHTEIAKLLINAGADVNRKVDWSFRGSLLAACVNGHVEIAKLLVEAGAHVNTDHCTQEPLWGACCGGHLEIAKILVAAGAYVNKTTGMNEEGALWTACWNGHLEIAKLLINAGANPNMINKYEISSLKAARRNGHTEIAKLLIDAGAHEDKQPLWTACSDGHLEVAKLLIDAGADVNETNLEGKGPLWAACCAGHLKIVKLLIDAGADVNKKTKMFMKVPLYAACYYNHVEIVKLLINATADVNATDKYGAGPLVTACECNNIEIAKLLIDAGADVNKIADTKLPLEVAYYLGCSIEMVKILIDARADVNKDTYGEKGLLQATCSSGEVEFAKLLIDAGASVNKTDKQQTGPLEEACSNGHMEIAKLLIDAGAIVNITKGFRGPEGPLYAACSNGHMEIAKLLIDAGANVNINKGLWRPEGPLYAACSNGHMEIVKLLIDAGADVNEIKKMPLWAACSNGHMEIAKLLIDAGADAKIKIGDRELEPLLERPCSKGHVEFAKLLIDAGADVNATDKSGYGPLMRACYGGHIEIVILLLDAGADVDKTNLSKEGPLWAACSNGHVEIAKLLINAGADVNKTNWENFSALHAFMKTRPSVLSLNFLKLMLSRDFSLVGRCGKDNLLPHEYPCPTEVRQFLFESWVQYRYYELYSKGTTKPKRIKICVIGEGKAGKTTLIKTLQNTDWRKGGDNRRTTSMDVSMATIKSSGEVVFCDFAGQPYFHKTHGLFFSESTTAFLLVVDLKKSYSELHESSFYFCSFVKCSVGLTELKKAFVIVTGSRKDELSNLENGERKLRQLAVNLRQTYGRWLNIYEKYFVLNCRDRKAKSLDLLKQAIAEVKMLVIERSKDVPLIVEAAVTSFLPTLRHPFQTPKTSWASSLFRRFLRLPDSEESEETKEIREKTLSSLRKKFSIPQNKEDSHYNTHVMNACVFKQLLVDSLWPGLSDEVQDLLVEFLQGIGEIFAIGDTIILDPPWLCQNAIGPLLSPEGSPEFPTSLQCSSPGTATKKQIQCALEAFNNEKWENIDETILLLCHLEICYPLLGEPDTYRFPARINEERPPDVWRENSEMSIYIGRRLRQAEETDIITPGTLPFLQCRVHNAACFRGLKPVIWKGGLMMHETIDGRSVEGMIRLQKKDKVLDFVVRGPKHSEKECMKFLTNLKETGEKILRQKSPGTNTLYSYISSAELKQLKDFPLAYAEEKVDEKIKTSTKSHISVSEGTIKDSLKDLFALPDNHVDFLSYKTRRAIMTCLEKDDAGRSVLREHLQGLSQADKMECQTAAMLLSTWSENLCATAESLADAAQKSRLLYLLALLSEDGAIQLSTEKKVEAEKDLKFIRTSSPSLIKRRFVRTATNVEREGEDVTSLFGDEFLDTPMISLERCRAAQRIQPKWRSIGRILGPKPFEHFEIHAFGEQRNDIDRALEMLDAWANKFGSKATRRHFINALKDPDVGYSYEVAAIFSGPH